ncbi:metal ABC transporter substrate-binding protein [Methyloligella sp. 2.7D]|uniref:metal ABC transporter substrate-binding protein n=1 Tax=unclassified Methyloligella TaxID=2625955 RepID=UPI00157C9994|nr:metal ABC transporter substrate-binding protein [Methyloligella sp. GL2]QKP76450.1 metal ABC transporter substrate-binding protein [Methyloligella sp. GL2]
MKRITMILMGLAFAFCLNAGSALAADKVQAVATFTILGDMVRQVGGDRVEVTTFIGPDGDPHDFEPTPKDARILSHADILVMNGLGLEGWLPRLNEAAGFDGVTVTATKGVKTGTMVEHEGHHHGAEHDHDEHAADEDHDHDHAEAHDHDHGGEGERVTDPHAWQSLEDGKIYVENIRDGLIAADPEGKAIYEANAKAYLKQIDAEDKAVRAAISEIPEDRRVIVTSHDAFGYFGREYGIRMLAPEGVSTESEASAKAVAKIIDQIREEKIPAVFVENISDPRLLQQIADETGAKIGGTLYSDALSGPDGPAPTYLDMFRHNVSELSKALKPAS